MNVIESMTFSKLVLGYLREDIYKLFTNELLEKK